MPLRLLMPLLLMPLLLVPLLAQMIAAEEVGIATAGKAELPVVVSEAAEPRVKAAAEILADYLSRISGGEFRVITGDGATGIAVGRPADFPTVVRQLPWPADSSPTRREDYLLRSHPQGLHVLGVTELAVEHAVWDLLYRLGHRQFFPGQQWEIVPKRPTLSMAVDVHEHPDYVRRLIWYGFGPWDYAKEPYERWCARNRCTSGIELQTGHAYNAMIARNRAVFDEHPEYLSLIDGRRVDPDRASAKFCISNPELRELVVQDSLQLFAQNPGRDSVSVDPSDGLGWCECADCQSLGSVSDRALSLANQVAEAVNRKYPGRLVGMYAYSAHSPPPTLRVHPQVVISVATTFIRGGYSVDDLMTGWNRQGATLGVREYYSVTTWDRDLPGRARGSDLDYITSTLPHFHKMGARFFAAESSDNWGPNGLGYYIAARLLWDTDDATQVDELVADFLQTSFGAAREPMAEFYRLIDGSGEPPPLSDHLIGRMYRLLDEARRASEDAAVQRRLDDLVLYTRYVELWFQYDEAQGQERQAYFEEMMRHVYRMRKTMMVHAKGLYRDVDQRDKQVSIPKDALWLVPEDQNPWKSSEPFLPGELDGLVVQGIKDHPLRGFEPIVFGTDLVPVARLGLAPVETGNMGIHSRGMRTYYTWVADSAKPIRLTLAGGRIYQDRGDVTVSLHAAEVADGLPLQTVTVPPDGKPHEVTLQAPEAGRFRVTVSDGAAGTVTEWPPGQPMTVVSDLDHRPNFHGRWTLYFYVPPGTEVVGGYSTGAGDLRNSRGEVMHTFTSRPGYFRVPVPQDEAGRLWCFHHSNGERLLMTVPPYLARSVEELLLPSEVVESNPPEGRRRDAASEPSAPE